MFAAQSLLELLSIRNISNELSLSPLLFADISSVRLLHVGVTGNHVKCFFSPPAVVNMSDRILICRYVFCDKYDAPLRGG